MKAIKSCGLLLGLLLPLACFGQTMAIYISNPNAITIAGPTAARTVTLPDASFTVARTDAANTFSGTQTLNAAVQMPNLATSSAAQTGTVCWTTSTGNLTVDTTTTCLLSDGRLKMNVEPLDVGLDEVMKLKPVSYDLRPEANPTHLGRQVGLIAQDVIKIDPRLAATYQSGPDEGTPSGVRYEQMVALLVKAVQDQQHEIDGLKRQLGRCK
jgi:Chaperone of endosialidase